MKNKNLKIIASTLIATVFLLNTVFVYSASTKTELNNQMGNINDQISEKKEEINDVKDQMSDKMREIQKLSGQISDYENQIADLDDEISDLEDSIDEQEKELKKAQEDYDYQNELLKKRLVALYEAGKTSYIDVLLSSQDITDFISRYYLITEIAQSDSELLQQIEDTKNSIETKKASLEASKEKIVANKKNKQETSNALKSSKSLKDKQVSQLSEQEQELQEQLDQFEKDKKDIQAKLKKIAEEEAKKASENSKKNNITTKPSASGYIRPVNFPITTGLYYSDGRYHGAVDFSGSGISGTPIKAVKDGTVVISTALKNSNGIYRSYGEYIVINHHDGTMTLYAHGAPGSRKVSTGNTVKQGQTIMNVGTTGNSTGYHLHFEVIVNGRTVDPRPYLP